MKAPGRVEVQSPAGLFQNRQATEGRQGLGQAQPSAGCRPTGRRGVRADRGPRYCSARSVPVEKRMISCLRINPAAANSSSRCRPRRKFSHNGRSGKSASSTGFSWSHRISFSKPLLYIQAGDFRAFEPDRSTVRANFPGQNAGKRSLPVSDYSAYSENLPFCDGDGNIPQRRFGPGPVPCSLLEAPGPGHSHLRSAAANARTPARRVPPPAHHKPGNFFGVGEPASSVAARHPFLSTVILSATEKTSPSRWLMKRTVRPPSRRDFIKSRNFSVSSGDRRLVGSSRIRISAPR